MKPGYRRHPCGPAIAPAYAVQVTLGELADREASDEEVRDFLRQRLIDQGRSPEEADEFLARMDDEG